MPSIPTGPAGLLATTLADDPTRPFLTYYDEHTGERTELSATTLDNWVAKTANLLRDGAGLDADGTAAVLLPAHWQSAAVLLGTWSLGMSVTGRAPADVAFAAVDRAAEAAELQADETYVLALAPLAQPVRELPPGTTDYVLAVRAHGDHFRADGPVDPDRPALDGESHGELVTAAADRAVELGLARGDRLLVPIGDAEPPVRDWLLAPLAAGASVVLCRNADADRLEAISASERATARLD